MKNKVIILFLILAVVPFSFGVPDPNNGVADSVPDSGSTILLVGMAVTGLLIVAKKLLRK